MKRKRSNSSAGQHRKQKRPYSRHAKKKTVGLILHVLSYGFQ